MLIRPTALILRQIFFWNLLVVARLESLITIGQIIFHLAAIMKEVYRWKEAVALIISLTLMWLKRLYARI